MYFSVPLNDVKARVNLTAVLTSLNTAFFATILVTFKAALNPHSCLTRPK